jgi:hypothetical protein
LERRPTARCDIRIVAAVVEQQVVVVLKAKAGDILSVNFQHIEDDQPFCAIAAQCAGRTSPSQQS